MNDGDGSASDTDTFGRAIGLATAAYHDLKDNGDDAGQDFLVSAAALSNKLGRYEIDVESLARREDVPAALRAAADSAANQVGKELLTIITALAQLFGRLGVLANNGPVNVDAFLQLAGQKNVIAEDGS